MRKSRDYLMKCLGFVLLFGFIYLGAIGGCNTNNGGGQDGTQALTENDFANDPNLFADPTGGIVVTFLEHPDSEEPDNDTGEVGHDTIPHRYTRTLNHTYCFTDDNVDSKHFMILRNSDGEEVLRALANGGCVTQLIEAGDYEVVLTHGGHVEETDPVFLMPIPEEGQVTKRYEFDQKEFRTAKGFSYKMHRYLPGGLVKFFESISNVFARRAIAQTGGDPLVNRTTLISINKCPGCNLMGVVLFGVNLTGANLSGANLTGADLTGGANLTGANLTGAILLMANLFGAILDEAILTDAILTDAILANANLTDADLTRADLTDANLTGANLNGAIGLSTADLTDAILSFATWIDGSTCDVLSVGECNIFSGNPTPCASLTPSGNIIKCLLPSVETEVATVTNECIDEICFDVTSCNPTTEELVISVDLVGVALQAFDGGFIGMNADTPMAIVAWGGAGGDGTDGFGGGGDGGASGFASTVTTVFDYDQTFGATSLFYYLGEGGFNQNICGNRGASTLVMAFEQSLLSSSLSLIAGGGGGATGGDNGGAGGQVIATINPAEGFTVGSGQNATAGSAQGGNNGVGGSGDADGNGGFGGEGGLARIGGNFASWFNGDPGVGSNGRGGNAGSCFTCDGCGGGGGGFGGGGGANSGFSGHPGAGGGSYAIGATQACAIAPNVGSIPSNPGTTGSCQPGIENFNFGRSGAVEIWIFTGGC